MCKDRVTYIQTNHLAFMGFWNFHFTRDEYIYAKSYYENLVKESFLTVISIY